MDIAIIIGLLLGVFTLVGGMLAKGTSLSVLINPAAIIIIFVGTTAAIFNAFPMKEVKRIPTLFKILFTETKLQEPAEAVNLIVELAQQARKEGLLSLEARLPEIEDPFIRKGLQLIVDGQDEQFLRDYLETEIATMSERHHAGALVFSQAGTYAPTLGVMGAVVGLIGALGHLDDINKLGKSISAAFVATLFGIFSGYVMWHPFANKLKRKSEEEVVLKTMLLEGLVSLQSGNNPIQIREKMMVFLTPEERRKLEEER